LNIHQAKANLSRLNQKAEGREEVGYCAQKETGRSDPRSQTQELRHFEVSLPLGRGFFEPLPEDELWLGNVEGE
jgi:hypothetical protein